MKLFFITGVSKGLGLALARAALDRGHEVRGLGRKSPSLNGSFRFHEVDLANPVSAAQALAPVFADFQPGRHEALHLIQNAGTVEPIAASGSLPAEEVERNLRTNLLSPLLLTDLWLNVTREFSGPRVVTHVSSGVAENPKVGWAAYSASKAGLRNYTLMLAEEHAGSPGFRAISFNPGVMDTSMQEKIRNSTAEDFPDVARFKSLKEQGKLRPADDVGRALIRYLDQPEIPPRVEVRVDEIL